MPPITSYIHLPQTHQEPVPLSTLLLFIQTQRLVKRRITHYKYPRTDLLVEDDEIYIPGKKIILRAFSDVCKSASKIEQIVIFRPPFFKALVIIGLY